MSNFRFKFLNNVPLTCLIELQNEIARTSTKLDLLSIDELTHRIEAEGIELGLSIGAYSNKKLIGFILHGNNNGKLFSSLTCIATEFKDLFLTAKMYDYALPLFRSFKLKKITMILNSTNDLTIRNYRKIGFKKWRVFECIVGNYHQTELTTVEDLSIEPASYYEYLVLFADKEILPSYDNSEFSISNLSHNLVIKKAVLNNTVVGYIVYDPFTAKIMQIFVKEPFRRMKVATLLVHSVLQKGETLKMTNVDSQYFPLVNFLKKIGGKSTVQGTEMELFLQ